VRLAAGKTLLVSDRFSPPFRTSPLVFPFFRSLDFGTRYSRHALVCDPCRTMTRFGSISSKKDNQPDSSSAAAHTTEGNPTGSMRDGFAQRKQSIFTVEKLNERCNLNQDFHNKPWQGTANYIKKYYTPSPAFFKRQLFKRIPFLDWIRHYNLKEWLISDIISGITIGIVHIPQGKRGTSVDDDDDLRSIRPGICDSGWPSSGDGSVRFVFPGDSLCFPRFVTASQSR
jgi:hypothetical protein